MALWATKGDEKRDSICEASDARTEPRASASGNGAMAHRK
jgi:hypothetical protein